jgi:predicted enzyme related to lactoylglutathione lyase
MVNGVVWLGLYVTDLKVEIEFYRDMLGLPLLHHGEGWADFDAGQGVVLELLTGGIASISPKDAAHQSLVVGFLVDDLDQAMALLQKRGVVFSGEVEKFRNQRWAHFCDPEGNQLEIKEIR